MDITEEDKAEALKIFEPMPKIVRHHRPLIITEKIDGTNACVIVTTQGKVFAGSKNRLLIDGANNFGFATWVEEHDEELKELGVGLHRGEWWGHGIQRGYGLPQGNRRFSLFNVMRWNGSCPQQTPPSCCHVVPHINRFAPEMTPHTALEGLKFSGSMATIWDNPEGIVIFHTASKTQYKMTILDDDKPKGQTE